MSAPSPREAAAGTPPATTADGRDAGPDATPPDGDAFGAWMFGRAAAPTPPPAAPPVVPGYAVGRRLGEGGMGAVYLAEDRKLGRPVAVKVMHPRYAADPAARARFVREARAAAAVRHDHVVPVYHVGEHGGAPFLVMPLLAGESLADRLRRGPLPPAEVARVGREAALGLAAAHALGLVHRDIKPANLWLEAPTGRVVVLDFGLARAADGADGLTAAGAVLGTPGYLAPEQANGMPVDPRADLFSLGATLYHAATGTRPFAGPTLTAVLRAVADHHPPAPHQANPAVPRRLSDLILRLLAKDPAGRPPSAAAVAEQLGESGSEPPAPRAPRRRRRVAWAAAVAVLGAVAVVAWPSARPPAPEPPAPAAEAADPRPAPPAAAVRYRGRVDVLVERETDPGVWRLVRLDDPRALPLRKTDKFRVEAAVDPPAYLYLVWVDPDRDVTPVYPWDPVKGWGSRPAAEGPAGRVGLPANVADRYTAPDAKPGVATMVLLARPTPLDVPDAEVRGWFEALPDLPLPPGGARAAAWFDDYAAVTGDPLRAGTFRVAGADDPFARWQGRLQKSVGGRAAFQTAVSFARAGGTE